MLVSLDADIKVCIDLALLLSDTLLVHNLRLHRLNEALKGVQLGLGLHFTQFAFRLLVLHVGEGAVHGALHILLYQRRTFRGLVDGSLPEFSHDACSLQARIHSLLKFMFFGPGVCQLVQSSSCQNI